MKRHSAQREYLLAKIDKALAHCHHNASLGRFPDMPDRYDIRAWEEVQWVLSSYLDDINNGRLGLGEEYIEGRIGQYGQIYCYGRGGATCVPEQWVSEGGGSYYSLTINTDSYSFGKLGALLADIVAWDSFVRSQCSSESIAAILEERLGEWIEDANKEAREYARRLTI